MKFSFLIVFHIIFNSLYLKSTTSSSEYPVFKSTINLFIYSLSFGFSDLIGVLSLTVLLTLFSVLLLGTTLMCDEQ